MRIYSLQIFSHDSVFLGEDGPTHQPIEQLWTSRLIPNHYLFRPANVQESIAAFKFLFESAKKHSVSIVTSRLPFKILPSSIDESLKGGYIISADLTKDVDFILVATGSEVSIAIEVAEMFKQYNQNVSVVSMPCVELFLEQPQEYKDKILMNSVKTIAIEAGRTLPWKALCDHAIGIDRFGESGPSEKLYEEFKMTKEAIFDNIKDFLKIGSN